MNNQENIKNSIEILKKDNNRAKLMNIVQLEKIVNKLDNNSDSCDECKKYLDLIEKVLDNLTFEENSSLKNYKQNVSLVKAHLQSKHKIVAEGYYLSIYGPMGMCIGVTYGIIFDNIGIGMLIGMCIGVAIGIALDSDAKKKGNVI